jgi:hypothetical protein
VSSKTTTVEQMWVDNAGRPGKTKLQFDLTKTAAQIVTLMAAAAPLLNAIAEPGLVKALATFNMGETPTGAGTVTGAGTCLDKIRWEWEDSGGNRFFNETPGPIPTLILADGLTVNQAQTDVAAWITWVKANLESPYGLAIIAIINAYRAFKDRKAKNK